VIWTGLRAGDNKCSMTGIFPLTRCGVSLQPNISCNRTARIGRSGVSYSTRTFDPLGTITTLDPGAAAEVPAGTKSVWIEPARGIAEQFVTTVIDPDTHLAVPFTVPRETLRYRFFATGGSFSPAITQSEPLPGFVATGPVHIESEYRLPSAAQLPPGPDGTAIDTIWIVVRDDRGGESWARRTLVVTPLP